MSAGVLPLSYLTCPLSLLCLGCRERQTEVTFDLNVCLIKFRFTFTENISNRYLTWRPVRATRSILQTSYAELLQDDEVCVAFFGMRSTRCEKTLQGWRGAFVRFHCCRSFIYLLSTALLQHSPLLAAQHSRSMLRLMLCRDWSERVGDFGSC